MIKYILTSVALFCFALGCQRNGRQNLVIERIDPKSEVGKFTPPPLEVPDSLGGSRLWADIGLTIQVHKSGSMLGYVVSGIAATLDKRKPPIIYHGYRPYIPQHVPQQISNTAQGDSLFRAFSPWIDQYYRNLTFTVNKECECFAAGDTVLMGHHILVEGKKQPIYK